MKKLFLAIAIAFLAVSISFAQSSIEITENQSYVTINKNVAVTFADSIQDFVFDLTGKTAVYYYAIPVKFNGAIDEAAITTPHIEIFLQSGNDGETWADIDTVNYACSADTIFEFSGMAAKVGHAYLRLHIDGADSISARLNKITGRFIQ